jgi:hypothetical protein
VDGDRTVDPRLQHDRAARGEPFEHLAVRGAAMVGAVRRCGDERRLRPYGRQERGGGRRAAAVVRDLEQVRGERVGPGQEPFLGGAARVAREQHASVADGQQQHERVVVLVERDVEAGEVARREDFQPRGSEIVRPADLRRVADARAATLLPAHPA